MKTNLKIVLLVAGMSLAMFLGIFAFHAYRFETSYRHEFLEEKKTFGEQVSNIALSGLQISNYYELSRLATGLFKKDSMLYLAILDEVGQPVHFSTEGDIEEIAAFRKTLAAQPVQEKLQVSGKSVAVVRSEIRDEAGKLWGTVEVCYYWDAVSRIFRDQLVSVFVFFIVFIPIWSMILLYNTRGLLRPLDQFVANLKRIESEWPIPMAEFNSRLAPAKASSEVKVLLNVLRTSLSKLIAAQEAHEREAKFSALGKQAAQVAHDIRSPLAAMDSITKEIDQLPEEKRLILRSAVGRIRDIANDLIERNRQLPKAGAAEASGEKPKPGEFLPQLLSTLVEPVVTEKRLQFRSKLGVEIDSRLEAGSYGLFASVQPSDFKRALSNLMNNAVEAMDKKGSVIVSMTAEDGRVSIRVRDNGKGIPPEVLARLGKRGETFGKSGGSGLGVYYAKDMAEHWGGSLEIRSEVGKGTEVEMKLPRAATPEWFLPELVIAPGTTVAVLDDDTSIHQIWRGRFESLRAAEKNVSLVHFSAPSELRSWVAAFPELSGNAFYLLDYELLGDKETGLSLAEELNLGARAALVTSRYEETHVLDHCRRLKMRMMPKGLAGLLPISISMPDAVLIDDDPLVRLNWKTAAKAKGVELKTYSAAADFMAAGFADTTLRIYIDSNLGDGVNGEEVARQLKDKGFLNIWLETGHGPEKFSHIPWLKVIGKEPPWG
jgi:signal transduction histidine kinase